MRASIRAPKFNLPRENRSYEHEYKKLQAGRAAERWPGLRVRRRTESAICPGGLEHRLVEGKLAGLTPS